MKSNWVIIRIVLALSTIFSLGVWVGRLTTPQVEVEPLTITIDKDDSSDEADLKKATLRSMTRYRTELDLTDEQVRTLRPKFVAVSRQMQVLPKLSKARFAALDDFHAELKNHLSKEQQDKLAAKMEKVLSRERSK